MNWDDPEVVARKEAFRQDVREGKWLATVNVALLVFIKEVLGKPLDIIPLSSVSWPYIPLMLSLLGAFFVVFLQYWAEYLVAHYGNGKDPENPQETFPLYRLMVLSQRKEYFIAGCFLVSVFGLFTGVVLFLFTST